MFKKVTSIFTVAMLLNWAWEILHSYLYLSYQGGYITQTILLRASLIDAVIITAFYLASYWLKLNAYSVTVLSGVAVATAIELWALHTGRWAYNEIMPIVPILRIGLTPFIQLAITGTVSLFIIQAREERDRQDVSPRIIMSSTYSYILRLSAALALIAANLSQQLFWGDWFFLPVPFISGMVLIAVQKENRVHKFLRKLAVGSVSFGFLTTIFLYSEMYIISNWIYKSGMPFWIFYNPKDWLAFSGVFSFVCFMGGLIGIVGRGFYALRRDDGNNSK